MFWFPILVVSISWKRCSRHCRHPLRGSGIPTAWKRIQKLSGIIFCCVGYQFWQQGKAGPGLPERRYWHEDEVELATSVATEDTEHLSIVWLGSQAFPQGWLVKPALMSSNAASGSNKQEVAGHLETDKLGPLKLWNLFPWFPFSNMIFCGPWDMQSVQ